MENQELRKLWDSNPKISITYPLNGIEVEVSHMYDYVEVGFKQLIGLAKFFGTDRFEIDSNSFTGCETCDYGSSYTKTFTVKVSNVGIWDTPGIKDMVI